RRSTALSNDVARRDHTKLPCAGDASLDVSPGLASGYSITTPVPDKITAPALCENHSLTNNWRLAGRLSSGYQAVRDNARRNARARPINARCLRVLGCHRTERRDMRMRRTARVRIDVVTSRHIQEGELT